MQTDRVHTDSISEPRKTLRDAIGGRSCDILGLGVSNLPLARFLCDIGVPLTVRDKKSVETLGEEAMALRDRGAVFVTGENCFEGISGELIFRSPGIRPDLPAIREAVARGAELTSETEELLSLTAAQTYAVTGSDGKTTSTTLTGKFSEADAVLRGQGRVYVGGNIGKPLLTLCDDMTAADRVVLELSSFQLMTAKHTVRHAALTNISPNHLDWHRGMEEYVAAKKHILGDMTKRFVTNAENELTRQIAKQQVTAGEREVVLFSSRRTCFADFSDIFGASPRAGCYALYCRDGVIRISDGHHEEALLAVDTIRVPGRHNVENFMTAMGLTYGDVDPSVYGSVAADFEGVEHRLEFVRRLDGVDYFNSSIDSSPTRTAAALSALNGRDIVVICGGYDKKIPFEPLAESLCAHVRAVVLTGATGEKIGEVLRNCPRFDPERLTVAHEPDFALAVSRARSLARRGGCVLLSPACASFDAFRNFAERGDRFKQLVMAFSTEEN